MRNRYSMSKLEAQAILGSVKLPKEADPGLLKKLKADLGKVVGKSIEDLRHQIQEMREQLTIS